MSNDQFSVPEEIYDLLGYRAVVRVASPEARAAVAFVLGGFGPVDAVPAPHTPCYDLNLTGDQWEVRLDGRSVHTGIDFSAALAALEWQVVTGALAHRSDLFHLHAAALCLPTQAAGIALAGDSGHGKTTLALSLMLRGFVPFGDDVALMDPATLELHALRRAFHVSADTRRLVECTAGVPIGWDGHGLEEYFLPPQWAERPVPLRWILFVEHRPGASPDLVPLAPADAATAILSQTISLAQNPRQALTACGHLTKRATCYRFITGDLTASTAAVQQLVAAAPVTV